MEKANPPLIPPTMVELICLFPSKFDQSNLIKV